MDLLNKYFLFITLISLTSCYYDSEEDLYPSRFVCDENKTISYERDLKPILNAECSGCHNTNNYQILGAGIKLDSPEDLKNNNRILGAIKHNSGFSNMPKNESKLSDCEILIFENWINQGGNDN